MLGHVRRDDLDEPSQGALQGLGELGRGSLLRAEHRAGALQPQQWRLHVGGEHELARRGTGPGPRRSPGRRVVGEVGERQPAAGQVAGRPAPRAASRPAPPSLVRAAAQPHDDAGGALGERRLEQLPDAPGAGQGGVALVGGEQVQAGRLRGLEVCRAAAVRPRRPGARRAPPGRGGRRPSPPGCGASGSGRRRGRRGTPGRRRTAARRVSRSCGALAAPALGHGLRGLLGGEGAGEAVRGDDDVHGAILSVRVRVTPVGLIRAPLSTDRAHCAPRWRRVRQTGPHWTDAPPSARQEAAPAQQPVPGRRGP